MVFNPYLAISLDNLSSNLSDLGYREDALTVIQEAVKLHQQLARDKPAVFNEDLAFSQYPYGRYALERGGMRGLRGVRDGETEKHEQVAGGLEAIKGEYTPPPVECYGEYDNGPSAHKPMAASTIAVEPGVDNAPMGEYHPPPLPPICDTTRKPQLGSIEVHEHKHDEEPDKHTLTPVITNAIEQRIEKGDSGSRCRQQQLQHHHHHLPIPPPLSYTEPFANDDASGE